MPESSYGIEELSSLLANGEQIRENAFKTMRSLVDIASEREFDEESQNLILRALEHRDALGSSRSILDGLVREVGLFPFLDPDELGLSDRLAYEYHRPGPLGDRDVVFHRPQARIYRELIRGRSVILSAPTSFGKSLIIDAIVLSGRYRNILIVVPTIALIDETRRRLARLMSGFKVITHPSQEPAELNIWVLTQERALEIGELDRIDFFVIDEFYKLAPERDGEERAGLLNQVFYTLVRKKKPFYLLGPSVTGIAENLQAKLECTLLVEPYHTVASELHRVKGSKSTLKALTLLCGSLDDPTIVFCKSPARAAMVAKHLIGTGVGKPSEKLSEAAEWVGNHYHPEWHFVRALSHGIGVHHGRIPRALAQYVVRAFDSGDLKLLICTSTLIEGVNTKARNMVILDNTIGRHKYDYFTFNNIRGRSGRMFKHFVGHVFLFHEPPEDTLPLVDFPAFSQGASTPTSLLVQIADEDLTESSRNRIQRYLDEPLLSLESIRLNVGIDPDVQIALAQTLSSNLGKYHARLAWNGLPTTSQLEEVCKLIWDHFDGRRLGAGSALSSKQLAFRLNRLRNKPSIKELVDQQLLHEKDPDKAVQSILDFLRLWASFHFPRLLRGLDRIQREVFSKAGLSAGEYSVFASLVENWFMDPAIAALDEYGIPIEAARKLQPYLKSEGNLDSALMRLRNLDLSKVELDSFEKYLIREAIESLGVPGE